MKTILKNFFLASSLAVISAFGFTSCNSNSDSPANNDTYTISGNASGSQVVPAVSGSAAATFNGTYNTRTNQLAYTMGWTGLTGAATSAGFYNGSVGVNGSLIANASISSPGSTGASVGTVMLTEAQETALLSGNMYYIVSTATNASGEVRGQLTATAQ